MKKFGEAPQAGSDYGPSMPRFIEEQFPEAHAAAAAAGGGATDADGTAKPPAEQAVAEYQLMDVSERTSANCATRTSTPRTGERCCANRSMTAGRSRSSSPVTPASTPKP